MVLYGLDGMTHRSQAYGLLAVGLREHWDLEQLPSIARGKRGKPLFRTSPSSASTSATADPGPCVPWTGTRWGWTSSRSPCGVPLFSTACSPQRSGPGCWGWETTREAFTQLWTLEGELLQIHRSGSDSARLRHPRPLPRQILPSGACLPFGSVCFTLFSGPGWRAAVCSPARCASSIRWLTPGQLPPVGKKIPKSEKSPLHFGRSLL